jgi:hypothetical protein
MNKLHRAFDVCILLISVNANTIPLALRWEMQKAKISGMHSRSRITCNFFLLANNKIRSGRFLCRLCSEKFREFSTFLPSRSPRRITIVLIKLRDISCKTLKSRGRHLNLHIIIAIYITSMREYLHEILRMSWCYSTSRGTCRRKFTL